MTPWDACVTAQVYDARALRVIVDDEDGGRSRDAVETCYKLVSTVHSVWKPVPNVSCTARLPARVCGVHVGAFVCVGVSYVCVSQMCASALHVVAGALCELRVRLYACVVCASARARVFVCHACAFVKCVRLHSMWEQVPRVSCASAYK